jgi:hypothetical protein
MDKQKPSDRDSGGAFKPIAVLVQVPNDCENCKNTRRVRGGLYREMGETVTCTVCRGAPLRTIAIPWDRFVELMHAPAGEEGREK